MESLKTGQPTTLNVNFMNLMTTQTYKPAENSVREWCKQRDPWHAETSKNFGFERRDVWFKLFRRKIYFIRGAYKGTQERRRKRFFKYKKR